MSYFIDLSLLRRNRKFRLLFMGQSISFIGNMVTMVALPYQIYHLTRSTLMVGLLSLAQLIPMLVTALIGGALADRHHRRMLILWSETLLAVGCAGLAWNSFTEHPSLGLIFIVSAAMSAVTGLHRPVLTSISQQVVEKKDFAQAGVLNSMLMGSAMIIGPALSGWILAHLGLTVTYIVDFFTFFVSLMSLLLMGSIPRLNSIGEESMLASLMQGVRYAISRQELQGSYWVDFLAMIFGMPMALFPALAVTFGGATTLGLLYSAPAVGAVLISFFSGWIIKIKRHGAAIAIAAILWGVAIIFFGLSSNLWWALFFLAWAGAFDAVSGIFRTTFWNETIPVELRGRLAGIEMISYLSGPKLGDTEAGLVASLWGVTFSIVSGGVLCVVGVTICCFLLPKFWVYRSEQ